MALAGPSLFWPKYQSNIQPGGWDSMSLMHPTNYIQERKVYLTTQWKKPINLMPKLYLKYLFIVNFSRVAQVFSQVQSSLLHLHHAQLWDRWHSHSVWRQQQSTSLSGCIKWSQCQKFIFIANLSIKTLKEYQGRWCCQVPLQKF